MNDFCKNRNQSIATFGDLKKTFHYHFILKYLELKMNISDEFPSIGYFCIFFFFSYKFFFFCKLTEINFRL